METTCERTVATANGRSDHATWLSTNLNAKAAMHVIGENLEFTCLDILVFISGISVDQSGRTLLDQTRFTRQ